jgi:Domain of unknown function (DUF4149)
MAQRCRRILPGLWAGLLLCIALVAAPATFAVLPGAEAGRVVSRIFVQQAWISLALAATLLMFERPGAAADPASGGWAGVRNRSLLWGTVGCTLLGDFAVQSLMPAARAGQGIFSFGQLHLVSIVFYGLKIALVLALAWRATQPRSAFSRSPSS